jgi:hypothetical protein
VAFFVARMFFTTEGTEEHRNLMKTIFLFMMLGLGATANATTYYVSSSQGSDGNSGTSSTAAWATLAHVNAQTFQPGDSILLRRGDVWNESLVPPSSGAVGNPITFDAYGVGAPPNLTGYYAVPASGWELVSGNAWKAKLPLNYTTVNFCLFGSIWGQRQTVFSPSSLTAQWDFYFANGYLYVFSQGNPALYYNEPIVPMALSNVPVINVNSQSWLTFQHILINWFDDYGVYVQGTSDHLVLANMEADSMIPEGTQPLGFYVNESAPGPGDIKIYNSEAHLNYDGFRFDGAAAAITMVNDKAYANRDGALVDNTGAVTYSYCHFYASSLAVAGSTDVEYTSGTGPIAGVGNVAADTPPAVQVWQRYPAWVTLTVDDIGMTPGADSYYAGTVLPVATAAGIPVGVAVTTGYTGEITPLIPEIQGWINAGIDVTTHSVSHTYYTNIDALDIQYTGSGTAATLSISNNMLTITVTGAPDSVSYNLATGASGANAEGTIYELQQALYNTGHFSTSYLQPCQGPYGTGCSYYTNQALLAQDLAAVSSADVKTTVYHLQLNAAQLTSDEIALSRGWMTKNLTGLPTPPVYVYPGGYENPNMEAITAGVPYAGARGALHEGGTSNSGQPITGANDTYASGFNVQNITSFGVNPSWMGIPPAQLQAHIQALVWKEMVWGVPWAVFWHLDELVQNDPVGGTEVTNLINDFANSGATVLTNTGLVSWLLTGTQESGNDGNFYYKSAAMNSFTANGALDFSPTAESPVVDAGANLGAAYAIDINGVNQNSYGSGWEIGAHTYIPDTTYGGAGTSGYFTIGGAETASAENGTPTLPLKWVDNNEATDGLAYAAPAYELNLGTEAWVTGPPAGCTFNLPYWTVGAPTFAGLQSAVNDVEACRTAVGAGFYVDIPPAVYTTTNTNGLEIPQTNAATASSFIVLRSTMDASLPSGQTVCAHGIQDNVSAASDIGLNNSDCTGTNMYFALGPSQSATESGQLNASMSGTTATFTLTSGTFPAGYVPNMFVNGTSFAPTGYNTYWYILSGGTGSSSFTAIAYNCLVASLTCTTGLGATTATGVVQPEATISGITTVSANTTTIVPVTVTGQNIAVPLMNGYVAPPSGVSGFTNTGVYQIDTCPRTNCEVVEAVAGPNQTGIYATFQKAHAAGVPLVMLQGGTVCATGVGTGCPSSNGTNCAAAGCSYTLANGSVIDTANYNDQQFMWQVSSSATIPTAITFCNASATGSTPTCSGNIGPDHWLFESMGASYTALNKNNTDSIIIDLGAETNESAALQLPTHIHFQRVWTHGDWTSTAAGANNITDAIHLNCNTCSLMHSQVSQTMRPGGEGHALAYGFGTNIKVDHNWIESGSIGSMFGGYSYPYPAILTYPFLPATDMEFRRNRFTYPYTWLGINPVTTNLQGWNAFSRDRKNSFERKTGSRWIIIGNIFENVDNSGGQSGPTGSFKVVNSSGGTAQNPAYGNFYWNTTNNMYQSGNIARNTCDAEAIQGKSNGIGAGDGATLGVFNLLFTQELIYNVTVTNPLCNGNHFAWDIGSAPVQWNGTVTRNAAGTAATFTPVCTPMIAGNCPSGPLPIGFGEVSMNVGDYVEVTGCSADPTFNTGTTSSGMHTIPTIGTPALAGTTPFGTTVVYASAGPANSSDSGASGTVSTTPTTLPGSVAGAIVSYVTGNQFNVLWNGGENGGGPFYINGTAYTIYSVTSSTSLEVVGSPGTLTGASYSYAPDCQLNYHQGFPQWFSIDHMTLITDSENAISSDQDYTSGPDYSRDNLLRNSIVTGPWVNLSLASPNEGTTTEDFNWDPTTLSAYSMVWAGRPSGTASLYTEYGNNPAFPDPQGCTGAGCSGTAPSMYFPTLGGVGFSCSGCSTSVPLTLPDYHGFALASGSPFSAGSPFVAGTSGAASDGTSMGANIQTIDADQTLNTFVCPYGCGGAGPYPDTITSAPTISANLFGADWNTIGAGLVWPGTDGEGNVAKIKTIRIWDCGLKWGQLQTSSAISSINWSTLDNMVNVDAPAQSMDVLYDFGDTPLWATSCNGQADPGTCFPGPTSSGYGGGTQCSSPGDASCIPPDDVNTDGTGTDAQFQAFVNAVSSRYGSGAAHKINYYELWNEADSGNFLCWQVAACGGGSNPATAANAAILKILLRMDWDAYNIVHCNNPAAKVVFHGVHVGTATTWGENFMNTSIGAPAGSIGSCAWPAQTVTGKMVFDIVNEHMRGTSANNSDPTQVIAAYEAAVSMMTAEGVAAMPLWDSEFGYNGTAQAANADIQAAYAAIEYALHASFSNPPIQRALWYTWDAGQGPLQGTEVGTAFDVMAGWLIGSTVNNYSLSGTIYSVTGTNAQGPFKITWDMSQNCNSGCTTANQVEPGFSTWTDLTGTSHAIAGGVAPVGYKPILLQ